MAYGTVSADIIQSSVPGVSLGAGNASIMKNRIINGAMTVSQYNGTSSASITSGTSPYIIDRFVAYNNATNTFTTQQSTTVPTGFYNSLVITNGTATSATSGMYQLLGQRIEAYNMNDFAFGTASAKPITVSFWANSSVTGTFSGVIRNGANTRFYAFSFTISSANTWTQISATIPGDTTGTWGGTNNNGMELLICLSCGTGLSGTAGAWSGTQTLGVTGQTQFNATASATFYITGVQLEVGSSATGFEYRQYGTEFNLCQRYFQVYQSPPLRGVIASGVNASRMGMILPVVMRANPTAVTGVYGVFDGSGTSNTNGLTTGYNYTTAVEYDFTLVSALNTGRPAIVYQTGVGSLTLSAEL